MAITQTGSILRYTIADSGAGGGDGNAYTITTTMTVPADAEIIIVGLSGYRSSASPYSGGAMTCTKGGVDTAMTAVSGGDSSTSAYMCGMFYLALPDTGTNKTLKCDWQGTGLMTNATLVTVTFWKGIDTASPVRDSDGAQSATTPPYTTPTLTAQSGDKIVAVGGWYAGAESTADSWTNLTELSSGDIAIYGSSDAAWAAGDPSGNTTVALASTSNSSDGAICALVLKPAAGGVTASPPVGAVSLTGVAPTLTTTVASPTGAVALTGVTPRVQSVCPVATGSVGVAGIVPVLLDGRFPPRGSVEVTGVALTLLHALPVSAGALTLTGIAPEAIPGSDKIPAKLVFRNALSAG